MPTTELTRENHYTHIHAVPKRPWESVGADLYELNSHSDLILVDYYSDFIKELHDTRSEQIITRCKAHFAQYGIPDSLISDNGPQFSSEGFIQFAKDYQFKHCTSIPRRPQSWQKEPYKLPRA